jgi:hypothetical protein
MFADILTSTANGPRYCSKFPDGTVVFFRLLTLKEYRAVIKLKEAFQLDDDAFFEHVYTLCAEPGYKDLIGMVKAGLPVSVGGFIFFQSFNYEHIEEELDAVRGSYNPDEVYESMKMVINTAFSAYKFEDLEEMDRPSLMRLFAKAEVKMGIMTKGEYKPMKLDSAKKDSNSHGIDFEAENRELSKAMNGANQYSGERAQGPNEPSRPHVKDIRKAAEAKAQRRNK